MEDSEAYKKKLKKAIELGMTPPTSAMSYECHKMWRDMVEAIHLEPGEVEK